VFLVVFGFHEWFQLISLVVRGLLPAYAISSPALT